MGEVETVEVGQAVLALDLVDAELDLAEAVVLILLEVGEGSLEDAALEGVVGVLQTGGAVDEGLADTGRVLVWYSGIPRSLSFFFNSIACARARSIALGRNFSVGGWVMAYSLTAKVEGALTEYQSFLAKGSVLFFRPFLPLDNLLFLPTAMFAECQEAVD